MIDLSQFPTERDLFDQFIKALMFNNHDLATEILMEYGRRGYETMGGMSVEDVCRRNPIIAGWIERGK